jgi:hypothetical protein
MARNRNPGDPILQHDEPEMGRAEGNRHDESLFPCLSCEASGIDGGKDGPKAAWSHSFTLQPDSPVGWCADKGHAGGGTARIAID